jgi:hypothetical protein
MDKNYVRDQLLAKTLAEVNVIRAHAAERGDSVLVNLCDKEISRREPPKIVKGVHLVCENGRNVKHHADGTFSSGSWVVATAHAVLGERIGAYVALHERQSEPSYLQGLIKGWRTVPREPQSSDEQIQTKEGIEFLLEPLATALPWRGEGTVEKSYWYGESDPSSEGR